MASIGIDAGANPRVGWLSWAELDAAIGVSAIVAPFFIIIVPVWRNHARQPDGRGTSVSVKSQSMRTTQYQSRRGDDDSKPAISEFPTPSAPTSRSVTRGEPELVFQFVQWQQNARHPQQRYR